MPGVAPREASDRELEPATGTVTLERFHRERRSLARGAQPAVWKSSAFANSVAAWAYVRTSAPGFAITITSAGGRISRWRWRNTSRKRRFTRFLTTAFPIRLLTVTPSRERR